MFILIKKMANQNEVNYYDSVYSAEECRKVSGYFFKDFYLKLYFREPASVIQTTL